MKPTRYLLNLSATALLMFLWSCSDKITEKYNANVPVYLSFEDLRKSVTIAESEPLSSPGKIYFKGKYIFINEQMKGVHVLDNTDPAKPKFRKFINIPGNIDIAIKGNMLYADSYVDLVVLDISDLNNIKEKFRIKDIFPYTVPVYTYGLVTEPIDQTKGVVLKWKEATVSKEVETYTNKYPVYLEYMNFTDGFAKANGAITSSSSGGSQTVGVGGSMARFSINGDALYVINQGNVIVFDISNIAKPAKISDNYVGWNIETLFMYEKTLFIGSQTGMLLYDVTNPFALNRLSVFQHVRSCDPVVVEGNYAYVTLRSGSMCGGNTNQLDIVDVENKAVPVLKKSYPMTNPKGLGIDGGVLFVCDGPDGLKVYDASDVNAIDQHMISHFKDIKTYDVIPNNGLLFMVGDSGFYQYDYKNLNNIKLLSTIKISGN
jgi:hypothetical protein